ncbi:sodium-coupled monocarboxylate transporter 2 [Folsomia candida]|uniref:sodium-coupled monocarboxylate transporter 2 n=1 Tax=Folsomia candida TaxID=158441 RepID=UPI000B8EF694|nr:sodium-coupled monocarboxylate transporter 2 [Folsomia candida]
MFEIAGNRGRLELFNWTIDPFMRHNTLNIILGNGFSGLLFLTHQPVLQRYCGLRSFKDAVKSIIWSYIFGFLTIGLVILTGISIFAHYADCDPLKSHQIEKSDQIVPFFVIQELAFIPGMMGLFAAVIFSAVLSTISSTLNSLAAVTYEDFLSKISFFRNMGDFGQTCTYKTLSVMYGVICVALAFSAEHFGSIFQAAITVVGAAIGVLGSVFLTGVFMPFVNKRGAISGLVVGISAMSVITIQAILIQKTHSFQPKLDVSIEQCSESVYENLKNATLDTSKKLLGVDDLKWPTKFFTVSYILYSFIGGMITIIVGVLVSVLTNGCRDAKYVSPEFLHPLIRPKKASVPPVSIPKAHINRGFIDYGDNMQMSTRPSQVNKSQE